MLGDALSAHGIAPLASMRLKAGLSQKELCVRSGIQQPHLSRLENGKVPRPDTDTLQRIAVALGATLEEVIASHQATIAES